MIKTKKYQRKPVIVDAVQVSQRNFNEVAEWCMGDIQTDGTQQYIRVRVHTPRSARQSMAFVGDWILYTEQGYKIYSNRSFHNTFDEVEKEVKT